MSDVTVYLHKNGRLMAYIKDTKKVISYPRYIMENALGRKLLPEEQVHHKDENPLNNDLDNLEIKLLGEHQREHGTKYYDKTMTCPWCGESFLWTGKQQRMFNSNKKRKGRNSKEPFCSRRCASEYGRHVQRN